MGRSPSMPRYQGLTVQGKESTQYHITALLLSNRAKKSIDEKQRLIEAMQSGVSPVGQKLFLHIRKTMEEVKWAGVSILVMGQVIISPPYQLENVKEQKEGKESNSKTLPYVKKLVCTVLTIILLPSSKRITISKLHYNSMHVKSWCHKADTISFGTQLAMLYGFQGTGNSSVCLS
ncbi:Protein LSM12 B [Portunus trituberculatus]|uniref:Protein LSM12 B n=1 Tax=Portunus trituberculatus TaxID=210409 RepID=A0A5B7H0Q2_PORTR|nr:Protein LSM12 B [Portunus trituberculatus]